MAEQFHRRPLEQIKLALLASGLFGRVYASFNDFAGHGYHGVSVLRCYLGFDAVPSQVIGAVREYELAPHWSRLRGTRGRRTETLEHGIVEFADGRLGIFHWTDVGYDSALRWWRSSRFLAEKGMGVSVGVGLEVQEWLTLLAPGGEAPRFIRLERRWVAERSFAWAARFRRLARDYERLETTLAGWHYVAFAMLLLQRCCSFITLPESA